MLDNPPDNFADCYKPEDWKAFVASRLTPEWEKLRAKMQGVRAKNQYNHHGGRAPATKEYSPPRPPTVVRASTPPARSSDTSNKTKKCSLHVIDPNIEGDGLVAFGYVKFEKADDKGKIKATQDSLAPPTQELIHPKRPVTFHESRYTSFENTLLMTMLLGIVHNCHKKKTIQYELKPDLFRPDYECWIDKEDVLDVCELGGVGTYVMTILCRYSG
uniref:Uncharacterized protein n=1 Tax=Cannabis sativa TaxID=3483 RepID=A0A803QBM3_CANSA